MQFEPHNRHLWIEPLDKKEEENDMMIIMPDDYKPAQSPYVIGKIKAMACDCDISLDVGDIIVVDRTTVQEIKAENRTIYVVKENYVYGRLHDETY
jgi:co-chaperonin GroES (HSP10)